MEYPEIFLYTQTHCADSARLGGWLRERGIPFAERNVTDDPEAMAELAAHKIFATPLLVVGDRTVLGFRPEAVEAVLNRDD